VIRIPHRALVPLAAVLALLAGCRPRTAPSPRVTPPPRERLDVRDLRREPVVRILLAQSVSAVEVRGSAGFVILDEGGRALARYGRARRYHLFQSPERPERLAIFSEVRRGRTVARAARRVLPFRGSVVLAPEKGGTLIVNGRHYRGRIRLLREGGHFHCLNLLPLELYLRGVVPHEIGRLGRQGYEALKTQAVVSRTYALQRLRESAGRPWDMVDTVMDQVYGGAAEEHRLSNQAIADTRGQVVWSRGEPAEVYYSSTCGGASAAIDEVWLHAPVPHLVSQRDADAQGRSWCRTSKYFRWRHSWSARQLGAILRAFLPQAAGLPAGTDIGRLRDLRLAAYTAEGRAKVLEVRTDKGVWRVYGDRIRTALKRDLDGLPLRSTLFRLHREVDAEGRLARVTAVGGGWGHGIGLCQVGAIERSKAGQEYREIIGAYFPGTTVRRLWR